MGEAASLAYGSSSLFMGLVAIVNAGLVLEVGLNHFVIFAWRLF